MSSEKKTTEELFELIQKSPKVFADALKDAEHDEKFVSISEYLSTLLEEHRMSMQDLIVKSLLSKSFVYQIFSGERNPGRDILLRIAFAMRLSLNETQELLKIGQKGILYPKVRRDAAIICCLERNMTLDETDEFLDSISEKSLLK